jgi:hypothetical protein
MAFTVALMTVAGAAHAQGINLAWNNCIGQSNAAVNIQYACDGSGNGTPFRLVASFFPPANLNAFVGIQMKFHLEQDSPHLDGPSIYPPLTDWWRLGIGECRDGDLAFPASLSGIGTGTTGTCQNPFAGANTGGGYLYRQPENALDGYVELLTAFARDTEIALVQEQQYISGVINLDTYGDVASEGIALCSGCCEKRAIVLDWIELYQTAGQVPPQQDIYILNTAATRQYVLWQDQWDLCLTPTRRTTWGAIKKTYR